MKQLLIILVFLPFITNSQSFKLTDSTFKTGDILICRELVFDFAKSTIRQESFQYLDSIVNFLNKNNNLIIEVGNHTDNRGSDMYSTCLTCNRAKAVVDYLISKGISKDRLSSMGYKDTKSIISEGEIAKLKTIEEIETAHLKNRRTEFKIIKILNSHDKIFDISAIEKKPEFPGGETELMKYFVNNLKYHETGNDCIFSKIYFSFTIDTLGKAIHPKVIIKECPIPENIEKSLIELIKNMPEWTVGESNGKKVNVQFNVPLNIHWE